MAYSLIWSDNDPRTSFEDFSFIEALDLKALIPINKGRKLGEKERELREYFTVCRDTLLLRRELFAELLEKPELFFGLEQGRRATGSRCAGGQKHYRGNQSQRTASTHGGRPFGGSYPALCLRELFG